eukprot:1616475-Amphidinium_carterae.1
MCVACQHLPELLRSQEQALAEGRMHPCMELLVPASCYCSDLTVKTSHPTGPEKHRRDASISEHWTFGIYAGSAGGIS